jgi:ABC-type nitrate/sulfonate/bicarbonate transport system permease component
MKKLVNTENNILPAIFIVFLLGFWEIVIRVFNVPKYILPGTSAILKALYVNRVILIQHTKVTVLEAGLGFICAVVLAVLLAAIMNRSRLLKDVIYPVLVISQTVPIIALAPLFMIWLGFGILPKIVIVVLVCFFPITISVTEGLETVDEDMINLMRVMKASPKQIFLKVQLPATLPAFFSGLKIAATYSIMGAVIGEWVGAKSGLGVYMTRAMASFKTDALFADILIIVVLSIFLFKIIEYVGKKIMPWNK